jgi:hypothetical protein
MWAMKIQSSADAMDFSQWPAGAATEPGEGARDDAAARENLEPLRRVRALDDFQGPVAEPAQSVVQLRPGIAAVGEYVS